ncbi:MAG: hypothetical protein JXR96_01490 [Deltaproteobacteria bacterium]|nr:hypothetical protein [Deltaproteobacteria bacterium]
MSARASGLAEICLAALLAGACCTGPVPSAQTLVVAAALLALACLPSLAAAAPPGGLRRDRALVLLAVLLLLSSLPAGLDRGLQSAWPLGPAAGLGLAGAVLALGDRRAGRHWTDARLQLGLAVGVALVACLGTAGLAQALLRFRSSAGMQPGASGFLLQLPVWAAAWFGLDAVLRRERYEHGRGPWSWLWQRRPFCLAAAAMITFGIRAVL